MSFVNLHTHSEYSWLDGSCIIDDLVQRAVELKMPAVAITDRNSVAGASRLWHQCIKAGIKPIIGLEIAVLNDPGDGRDFFLDPACQEWLWLRKSLPANHLGL